MRFAELSPKGWMTGKKGTCLAFPIAALLNALACVEPLNEETYDNMAGMRLQLSPSSALIEHMQRIVELSILPQEGWRGRVDPCPELAGLRVSVDGEPIETTFGGSEYLLDEGWPIIGSHSGPYCPPPESSYRHYMVYSVTPPAETNVIDFVYQDQSASLSIDGLWSTPYWLVASPHEVVNDQVAVSPGDRVAFELSYGNEQVRSTYLEDGGVYAIAPGEHPYDRRFRELVSDSYDETSRRLVVAISPDAERGTIISMRVEAWLEWDAISCDGWLACEVDTYLVAAPYNIVVR